MNSIKEELTFEQVKEKYKFMGNETVYSVNNHFGLDEGDLLQDHELIECGNYIFKTKEEFEEAIRTKFIASSTWTIHQIKRDVYICGDDTKYFNQEQTDVSINDFKHCLKTVDEILAELYELTMERYIDDPEDLFLLSQKKFCLELLQKIIYAPKKIRERASIEDLEKVYLHIVSLQSQLPCEELTKLIEAAKEKVTLDPDVEIGPQEYWAILVKVNEVPKIVKVEHTKEAYAKLLETPPDNVSNEVMDYDVNFVITNNDFANKENLNRFMATPPCLNDLIKDDPIEHEDCDGNKVYDGASCNYLGYTNYIFGNFLITGYNNLSRLNIEKYYRMFFPITKVLSDYKEDNFDFSKIKKEELFYYIDMERMERIADYNLPVRAWCNARRTNVPDDFFWKEFFHNVTFSDYALVLGEYLWNI